MRKSALCVGLVGALLACSACVDSPVLPEGDPNAPVVDQQVQGCVRDGLCLLEPIVVGPEECDPWLSLDWCSAGGDCMASIGDPADAGGPITVLTCPGAGGGGGGGGGAYPAPVDDPGANCPTAVTGTCPEGPETCDPRYDPECHQPLTPADSAVLRLAKQRHQKPAAQFTDPAAAQMCAQLLGEFDRLFNAVKVYRGGSETRAGDPHTPVHVALYYRDTGSMHFEPSALDAAGGGDASAVRNIYNSALHEAAHSLGFTHTEPVLMGAYDLYAEPPFDLLSPGSNSCIANW